jgi:hypothetical protein
MAMRLVWILGIVVLTQVPTGCYQRSPWGKCAFGGCLDETDSADGDNEPGGTGAPTTSTTTWDEPTGGAASSASGGSGTEATDAGELPPPVIADMTLNPTPVKSAGTLTVEVKLGDGGAEAVTITVDGGEPAALTPVGDGGALFTGEIAVFGESWNGDHEVVAVAARGEEVSEPWSEWFTVEAPAAGSEAWLEKSQLVPSYGNAIDVDDQGDVLELFTHPTPNGQECYLRRRDETGASVWTGEVRWLAPFEDCVGEDVKFAPDGTIWALVNVYKNGLGRWQLWHLDDDGMPLGQTPQIGSLTHLGRGLDVNAAGDVLLCGTAPATQDDDAWIRLQPAASVPWTVPWDYLNIEGIQHKFSERTQDCAFVEDRIVVVGEAWGPHEKEKPQEFQRRGFVLELSLAAAKLAELVNSSTLAWHSDHTAVAPDGKGGYVAVGYNCEPKVTPCNDTEGALRWFSLGATELRMQPVTGTSRLNDVTLSPAGYAVVAGTAMPTSEGFLAQAWSSSEIGPILHYQSMKTKLQSATGIAADPVGFIVVGGYFQEVDDTLVAGVAKLHPY